MKVNRITVKNFRGIDENGVDVPISNLSILIGDNGTSKTAILEALFFCLMRNLTSSRFSIDDFYQGKDVEIEIVVYFDSRFMATVPDGFTKQTIECHGIVLKAHKRSRAATGRAFNDLVVINHYFLPVEEKSGNGWKIKRKSGSELEITEMQLEINYSSANIPSVFYFSKTRERQLTAGYNSSISNVIDELNWRFEKSERAKGDEEKFKHKNSELHKHIFDNTDGDSLTKTVDALNAKLENIGIEPVSINLLKTLSPYDKAELVRGFDSFELPISRAGSGIEMIISILFLETLASISREEIFIIVDEPELHLHPTLQDKLVKYFGDICKDCQVVISTHSPFLFKHSITSTDTNVLLSKVSNDKVDVINAKDIGFGLLQWSPSWGEICYFAYDLPTPEFHDDLYATLQDRENKERIAEIEAWFVSKGQTKEISWTNSSGTPQQETLMTYIRNRIHHGDNQNRPMYSPSQLKDSIDRMINFVTNP